jgi:hypothetical protein
MVGLDLFRERFSPFADRFVLIGGAACQIAMTAVASQFRATKDLDVVLCLEAVDTAFANAIWAFLKDGVYSQGITAGGKHQYYRFNRPQNPGFPAMLEFFSRVPEALVLSDGQRIVPAIKNVVDEGDPLSLSAILLDDDYYGWLISGRVVIAGIPIVRPEHLIPLKARAWLDLTTRRRQGADIDERDIRKHRNDIIRLIVALDPEYRTPIPKTIQTDMEVFIAALNSEIPDPVSLGLRDTTPQEIVSLLRQRYLLG